MRNMKKTVLVSSILLTMGAHSVVSAEEEYTARSIYEMVTGKEYDLEFGRPEYDASEYIKELGEYSGMEIEVPTVIITDDMLQEEISYILSENPEYVEEGAIESGDIVHYYAGEQDPEDLGLFLSFDEECCADDAILGFPDGIVGQPLGFNIVLVELTEEEQDAYEYDSDGIYYIFACADRNREYTDEAVAELSKGLFTNIPDYEEYTRLRMAYMKQEEEAVSAFRERWLEDAKILKYPEDVLDFYTKIYMDFYHIPEQPWEGNQEDIDYYEHMMEVITSEVEEYLEREILETALLEAAGMPITENDYEAAELDQGFGLYWSDDDSYGRWYRTVIREKCRKERVDELLLMLNTYQEASY